ncbi:CYP714A1 [Symbiodinium necroappetens]|uniref:CYP714A1 protein n=1 Tax=Symbiodinium necroappetens TaxID=1628268 RepID=A0A812ZWE1_9DINO|nr:CYP714A1 [Symbiodinium necroappetens]
MALRVRVISQQLCPQPAASKSLEEIVSAALEDAGKYTADLDELKAGGKMPGSTYYDFMQATNHLLLVTAKRDLVPLLHASEQEGGLALTKVLPGPWDEAHSISEKAGLLQAVQKAFAEGSNVQQIAAWQQKFGKRGLSSNLAVPQVVNRGSGSQIVTRVDTRVIVADPDDAARLSRIHVQKDGQFEAALMSSVISTTDNTEWRAQRKHLTEAFLPLSSLAQIMPVSFARAASCAERLMSAATGGTPVDMSDFKLHEAQAQLQLALLGLPEDLMNSVNAEMRSAFHGNPGSNRKNALADAMSKIIASLENQKQDLTLPSSGCPVKGPLSKVLNTAELPPASFYGNLLLILFAGHDTTGHTMTWLLFELARNPLIQSSVQAEVDDFFRGLDGRDPNYQDLSRLPLLDRCITETLRLWPAVANGTFRRLQFADTVKGADGREVHLPKGTLINIVNWSRHRNPEIWGQDANDFNPYRNFEASEVAHVGCPMAAVNPQSPRFSPFAHSPRSCLGRNFAQMELRVIMLNLLRSFSFSLAPPYDALYSSKISTTDLSTFHGVNRFTMGPLDLERQGSTVWGKRPLIGLKMIITHRQNPGGP